MSKIYGVPLSPMVRKVLAALEIKEVEYQLVPVSPFQKPEGFQQISPLQKIPAYQDDRVVLADSTVICEYLEDRYPEVSLYPSDPALKARARWLEEYADTVLLPVLGTVFFERVAKKMANKEPDEAKVQAALQDRLPAVLSYLESEVPKAGYLFGPQLQLADIAIATHFINLSYGEVKVDGAAYPTLAGYVQRLMQHPAMAHRMAEDRKMLSA